MKRILSMILSVILLSSIPVFADTMQLSDVQKDDLYNLEIMVGDVNGDLRLGDNITRAEAAKMLCTAGNIAIVNDLKKEYTFPDVSDNYWAYDYICALRKNGIVAGDEKGNFNPEDNITNEEIVKMIVSLLGYAPMADTKGGYPAGYNETASRLGITKNLSLNVNSAAVRNDAAIMIHNALDIPMMAKTDDGRDDAAIYIILDGKNGNPYSILRGTRGLKPDTSRDYINELAQSFASQYPYKEGDTEKSFELYPDVLYTSGLEKTSEGVVYECPAIYDDNMAYELVNGIERLSGNIEIGDLVYNIEYATFNSKILVPLDTFRLLDCEAYCDNNKYVATIKKDDVILEILPNVIGMRKNQADGYWVPLEICARFIDDTLYVPLEAVAKEFGIDTEINLETHTISVH